MNQYRQEEDYRGSTFNEVQSVIMKAPVVNESRDDAATIREEISQYENGQMPTYRISLLAVFDGRLSEAALRTIRREADYHEYFKKEVHMNGVCVMGTWEITELSQYSGYFAQGSKALFVGRVSTGNGEVEAARGRPFGLAGKIFPTLNRNERVKTANFNVIDDLNGTTAPSFFDVAMTNEPPFDLSRWYLDAKKFGLREVQKRFETADQHAEVRQLYPISQLGLSSPQGAKTPRWMKITTAQGVKDERVAEADFRKEVLAYSSGLKFDISVSDTTKDGTTEEGWSKIGQINTDSSIVSFGCDRRLHFHHPSYVRETSSRVLE
ncbi:MAG: hypothetical protein C5B49_03845 [Bdellovibrio sp.]|nr:MAG: hypothetical protein C5B49_03845 [Bdellovibrio sp.]